MATSTGFTFAEFLMSEESLIAPYNDCGKYAKEIIQDVSVEPACAQCLQARN